MSLPRGYPLPDLLLNFTKGEVVYRSKLNIAMLSSMEEDLISAVNSAKADRFLRSMLQ